jgi:hypothetical protein
MTNQKKKAHSNALGTVRKYFPSTEKVKDADGDLTLCVTANDVKESKRKQHDGCALAVRMKREFEADGVIVGVNTAYVIKDKVATRYKVTERASREIVSFDRGASFEPGTYKLKKPTRPLGEGHNHPRGDSSKRYGDGKARQVQIPTVNIRSVLGSDNVK